MDNMQLLIGLLLVGGAIGLAIYAVLSQVTERAVAPVLSGLTNLGRRFTPVGYVDSVRQKFIRAGDGTNDAVDRFLAVRVITIAAIVPITWFVFFFNPLGLTGMAQYLVFAILMFAAIAGPDAMLNRRVAERQHDLRVKLPDILDLLTISVEAGLGFEQALA